MSSKYRIHQLVATIVLAILFSVALVTADLTSTNSTSGIVYDVSGFVSTWTSMLLDPFLSFWGYVRTNYPQLLLAAQFVAFIVLLRLRSIVVALLYPLQNLCSISGGRKCADKINQFSAQIVRTVQLAVSGLFFVYFNSHSSLRTNAKLYLALYAAIVWVVLFLGFWEFWRPGHVAIINKNTLGVIVYSMSKYLSYFNVLFFFTSLLDKDQGSGNGVVYNLTTSIPASQRLADVGLVFVLSIYAREECAALYADPSTLASFIISSIIIALSVIPWYYVVSTNDVSTDPIGIWNISKTFTLLVSVSLLFWILYDFLEFQPDLEKSARSLKFSIPGLDRVYAHPAFIRGRDIVVGFGKRASGLIKRKQATPVTDQRRDDVQVDSGATSVESTDDQSKKEK